MKSLKRLGIWMDHSLAHLTELRNGNFMTETIEAKAKPQVNPADLYFKDESHMLNKEQSQLAAYYKKLSDIIVGYDEVILFGPTDAKNELANILKDNHLFEKTKIVIQPADKMTEKEQHEILKEFMNSSASHLRVVK